MRHRSVRATWTLAFLFTALSTGCSPQDTMTGPSFGGGPTTTPLPLSTRATMGLANSPFPINTASLSRNDQETIGIGSYLVNSIGGCNDCHAQTSASGPPKFLGGGTPFALGGGNVVYARNLTSDPTVGMRLTAAQFVESMRTGRDFKSATANEQLIVMPWFDYRWMSTSDLTAMYAYLQLVPPLNSAVPSDAKGGAAALTPLAFPTRYDEGDVARPLPPEGEAWNYQRGLALQPLADPPMLATLSRTDKDLFGRGAYLMASGGCNDCHTNPDRDYTPGANFLKINTAQYLSGGRVFAVPPGLNAMLKQTRSMSANLTGMTNGVNLTAQQFIDTVVKYKHVTDPGTPSLAFPMTTLLKNLVDEDLQALYTYLTVISRRTGTADKLVQEYARYCTMNNDCNTGAGETCDMTSNECVGKACTSSPDCDACQTCSNSKCVAPAVNSTCVSAGI